MEAQNFNSPIFKWVPDEDDPKTNNKIVLTHIAFKGPLYPSATAEQQVPKQAVSSPVSYPSPSSVAASAPPLSSAPISTPPSACQPAPLVQDTTCSKPPTQSKTMIAHFGTIPLLPPLS